MVSSSLIPLRTSLFDTLQQAMRSYTRPKGVFGGLFQTRSKYPTDHPYVDHFALFIPGTSDDNMAEAVGGFEVDQTWAFHITGSVVGNALLAAAIGVAWA